MELRYYQRESLDALYQYWNNSGGNGLIVLPTGAGKAYVIAKLIEELLSEYPDLRILNVTHSAKLVEQNFKEFIGISPYAPAGIYSASLGIRQPKAQVLFCGIQSVAKRVKELGNIDLVIVDEAHAISRNDDTLYGKFFKSVKEVNEDSRVCGLTATDYRTDSGRLTEGDDRLFDDVVYEASLVDLMNQGYLTRLVSQKTTSKVNLKGVHSRGGDYVPGELSDAMEKIIEEAVAEDMVSSEGRRAALFFCAGKKNAEHAANVIRSFGRTCAVLTSDNAHEIDKIFKGFVDGAYWAIASVNMITTGTNFPFVDFISLLISTKSPGKLVQILGRGTRNCAGKDNCLVADHGRNLAYHGPIDQISPKAPGTGDGEQPKKICPVDREDENGNYGCGEAIPISRMTCHCCGYVFPPSEDVKLTAQAADAPIISTSEPEQRIVTSREFRHHPGKAGKPDTVKITYWCGYTAINSWLCPEHGGYAGSQAKKYWLDHGGERPFPKTVMEWLERQSELATTREITVEARGKYWNVVGYTVGERVVVEEKRKPWEREAWEREMDDDIPF